MPERIKDDVRPKGSVLEGTIVQKYLSKKVREEGNNYPNPPVVKIFPNPVQVPLCNSLT